MIDNRFSISYYIELVKNAKTRLKVADYKSHSAGIILRHDIDFSLEFAFELSRIEKRNSILSTYYILLTSDLYNPFSQSSIYMIKRMINDGFEIGLHFDPTIYGHISAKKLEMKFRNEISILELAFDFKVQSFSYHKPSIHGVTTGFDGIINAYNSEIFSDFCYLSDSMYSFRGKDPIEFTKKSETQLVQFLTHPVHFFTDGNITYEKQINYMLNNYYKKMKSIFEINKKYLVQKDNYRIKLEF
jgi:hypothetical protein